VIEHMNVLSSKTVAFGLFFTSVIVSTSAFAQDDEEDSFLDRWDVQQKVQFGATYFLGDAAASSSADTPENYEYGATYFLDSTFEVSDTILFNFDGFLRASHQNLYEGVLSGPQRSNDNSPFLDFTEAAFSFENDNFDIILGKTDLSVGMAELYSPMDIFGASDATLPFNAIDYGRWQIQAKTYLDNDTLTFSYLPFDTSLAAAKKNSRWAGKSTSASFFSATGDIKDSSRKNGFESATFVGMYEGVGDGFDYVIGAFHGLSPYAVVKQENFALYEDRPTVTGALGGISYVVDSSKYYIDSAYQNARDAKDDDFLKSVFGMSYTDSNYAADWNMNKIELVLEYSWDYRFQRQTHPNYNTSSADSRPFPQVLLGKAEFEIDDKLTIVVGGNVGLKFDDNAQFFAINYGVTDDFKVSLQGRFFAGKEGTQFASQAENDYILIGAEYNF